MFTRLFVVLVLSVLFLTPQTSLALNIDACKNEEAAEGSGFIAVDIITSVLGTGTDVWALQKDVKSLKMSVL